MKAETRRERGRARKQYSFWIILLTKNLISIPIIDVRILKAYDSHIIIHRPMRMDQWCVRGNWTISTISLTCTKTPKPAVPKFDNFCRIAVKSMVSLSFYLLIMLTHLFAHATKTKTKCQVVNALNINQTNGFAWFQFKKNCAGKWIN